MTPANDNYLTGPRLWIGFAMMCIGMFLSILDVQIVATSLPTIRKALAIPADVMSWIQTAYLIAEIIAIPLTGFLTRLLSMRRLFIIALTLFTIASIGCAVSDRFETLIAFRILQGLAGGTLIPAVFSAVFLMFPEERQAVATTIAGVLAVLAPTVGPIVGGWITDSLSWHWLFLINVIPGFGAAFVGSRLLPKSPADPSVLRGFGLIAFIAMALALGTLEIGLKEAPDRGWTSPLVIALMAAAIVGAAVFAVKSWRSPTPIVDVRLIVDLRFAIGCALSFVLGAALYGWVYLMPLFLAFVRDHSAFEIGTIMLVSGIAQLFAAPLVVAIERRSDARLLTLLGFSVFAIGLYMSAFQTIETDADQMFWPQVVRGLAVMFCLLPVTRLALGHLPLDKVPDGSGLFNLIRNLGGAIGLALIDTVVFGQLKGNVSAYTTKVMGGDPETLAKVGLANADPSSAEFMNDAMQQTVGPLIRKLAFADAVNDAWMMLAIATALVVALIPLAWLRPMEKPGSPLGH